MGQGLTFVIAILLGMLAFEPSTAWPAAYHVMQVAGADDQNPGTLEAPLRTLTAGARVLHPGDTLVIHAGIYREAVRIEASGTASAPIVIEGAQGESVVITGANSVASSDWDSLPGQLIWRHMPWTYRAFPAFHPSYPKYKLIGRTEQVVLDGKLLRQVLTVAEMQPGTFCADPETSHALYVWLPHGDSPQRHEIEASVRPLLMRLVGDYLIVRNLRFRFASNHAQEPALDIQGTHDLVDDCVIEWTNGEGAALGGSDNVLRRVVSRFNGQLGIGARGTNNRLEKCALVSNNLKGFANDWEAGGVKVVFSRRFEIDKCTAIDNAGNGFSFDLDNRDGVIERSYAADNDGSGVEVEISSGIGVLNNVFLRNGLKDSPTSWQYAGILIAEATHAVVEHNLSLANRTGIEVRQQAVRILPPNVALDRPTEQAYYSEALVFRNNISAFNRLWQFALFGDNMFFDTGTSPKALVANRDWRLLDPDRRSWIMSNNLYWPDPVAPKLGLILWGAPWETGHHVYRSLGAFQAEHHLDAGSLVANPEFVNWQNDSLELVPISPARRIGAGLTQPFARPFRN